MQDEEVKSSNAPRPFHRGKPNLNQAAALNTSHGEESEDTADIAVHSAFNGVRGFL